jgi:hypothetical protein
MFLSHTLTSALRLAVMEQCFATSNIQLKKTSPSLWYWPRRLLHVQTDAPVPFCGLFWNPLFTNFTEVTFVADDFIGRTMTDPHLVYHFVDSHRTVVENWCMDLLSVPFISQCGWVLVCNHTQLIVFSESSHLLTPSAHRSWNNICYFSFCACVMVSGMWMPPVVKDNWMVFK